MRIYTHKKKTSYKAWWYLVGLMLIILAVVLLWPEGKKPAEPGQQPAVNGALPTQVSNGDAVAPAPARDRQATAAGGRTTAAEPPVKAPAKPADKTKKAYGPAGMTVALADQIGPSILTVPPVSAEQARADYASGWALYQQKKDLIKARTLLNRALNSGHLEPAQAVIARKALEDLANLTIFNRSTYVNPSDPYLISYKFKSGDMLNSKRDSSGRVTREGIISKYDLCVPAVMIPYVNGFGFDARHFQAGKEYKLIKGPIHVVVYKSKRAADIYLRDLFIRRVPVAIGKPETPSPVGYFRVVCWSGKTANSTYYPPADMGGPCIPIAPGQAGYPLGPKGYNIKIEGIPELGTKILASQAYALHGTNDPSSLGTQASRGCIRFGDKEIEFLYGGLMDYADPKNPKANWKHWSTVTISP